MIRRTEREEQKAFTARRKKEQWRILGLLNRNEYEVLGEMQEVVLTLYKQV